MAIEHVTFSNILSKIALFCFLISLFVRLIRATKATILVCELWKYSSDDGLWLLIDSLKIAFFNVPEQKQESLLLLINFINLHLCSSKESALAKKCMLHTAYNWYWL